MVDRKYIDGAAMFNNGNNKVDNMPVNEFEASVSKQRPPIRVSIPRMIRQISSYISGV